MRNVGKLFILATVLALALNGCGSSPSPISTAEISTSTIALSTPMPGTPTLILEPTLTPSNTPTPTPKPTKTPIPIVYDSLGAPFAIDCGDGIPRVLFDNEFNGIEKSELINSRYGHVDLYPPAGCDIYSYSGEIIAPVSGEF